MGKIIWTVVLMLCALAARGQRSAEDAYELGKFYLQAREQPAAALEYLREAMEHPDLSDGIRARTLSLMARAHLQLERVADSSQALAELDALATAQPDLVERLRKAEEAQSASELERLRLRQEELLDMIIPRVAFEDATIETIIRFLREQSKELDPQGEGINIILRPLSPPRRVEATPEPEPEPELEPAPETEPELEIELAPEPETEGAPEVETREDVEPQDETIVVDQGELVSHIDADSDFLAELSQPSAAASAVEMSYKPVVSLDLSNVTFGEAIRYLCETAGLMYHVNERAVIIADRSYHGSGDDVRFYQLSAEFLELLDKEAAHHSVEGEPPLSLGEAFARLLESMHVDLPEWTQIRVIRHSNTLLVTTNTQTMKQVERCLEELDRPGVMVQVSARLVEVREPEYLAGVSGVTYPLLMAIPRGKLRASEAITAIADSGGEATVQLPTGSRLVIKPVAQEDNYTVMMHVDVTIPQGEKQPLVYQAQMKTWDGAGIVLPVRFSEYEGFLVIDVRLLNYAGVQVRPAQRQGRR